MNHGIIRLTDFIPHKFHTYRAKPFVKGLWGLSDRRYLAFQVWKKNTTWLRFSTVKRTNVCSSNTLSQTVTFEVKAATFKYNWPLQKIPSHNALCSSPKILHKHCFQFLLGHSQENKWWNNIESESEFHLHQNEQYCLIKDIASSVHLKKSRLWYIVTWKSCPHLRFWT